MVMQTFNKQKTFSFLFFVTEFFCHFLTKGKKQTSSNR